MKSWIYWKTKELHETSFKSESEYFNKLGISLE